MIEGLSRALVTGATGFIGSALTQRLSAAGTHVICLVRKGRANTPHLPELPHVTYVETDFSSKELDALLPTHAPDVIFHLASAGVRPDERDPDQLIAGNVALTTRLVQACLRYTPRQFIFTGSCSEYAPIATGSLLREEHPLVPTSLYGAAKASAYLCGRSAAISIGVPFVNLRLFGVFGPGEGSTRLIPYLYSHLASGHSPELTLGEQARDFTYIDDVVDALITASTARALEPYRAYNVCSGRPVRVRDIALLVAQSMGRQENELGLGKRPYRVDESLWIVGDPTSYSSAANYSPRIGVEEGVRRMINALGTRGTL